MTHPIQAPRTRTRPRSVHHDDPQASNFHLARDAPGGFSLKYPHDQWHADQGWGLGHWELDEGPWDLPVSEPGTQNHPEYRSRVASPSHASTVEPTSQCNAAAAPGKRQVDVAPSGSLRHNPLRADPVHMPEQVRGEASRPGGLDAARASHHEAAGSPKGARADAEVAHGMSEHGCARSANPVVGPTGGATCTPPPVSQRPSQHRELQSLEKEIPSPSGSHVKQGVRPGKVPCSIVVLQDKGRSVRSVESKSSSVLMVRKLEDFPASPVRVQSSRFRGKRKPLPQVTDGLSISAQKLVRSDPTGLRNPGTTKTYESRSAGIRMDLPNLGEMVNDQQSLERRRDQGGFRAKVDRDNLKNVRNGRMVALAPIRLQSPHEAQLAQVNAHPVGASVRTRPQLATKDMSAICIQVPPPASGHVFG